MGIALKRANLARRLVMDGVGTGSIESVFQQFGGRGAECETKPICGAGYEWVAWGTRIDRSILVRSDVQRRGGHPQAA